MSMYPADRCADMVLEDVTELYVQMHRDLYEQISNFVTSDYSGAQTKLPKVLLNGNNVCMVGDGI